jgi:hypothetical protein
VEQVHICEMACTCVYLCEAHLVCNLKKLSLLLFLNFNVDFTQDSGQRNPQGYFSDSVCLWQFELQLKCGCETVIPFEVHHVCVPIISCIFFVC